MQTHCIWYALSKVRNDLSLVKLTRGATDYCTVHMLSDFTAQYIVASKKQAHWLPLSTIIPPSMAFYFLSLCSIWYIITCGKLRHCLLYCLHCFCSVHSRESGNPVHNTGEKNIPHIAWLRVKHQNSNFARLNFFQQLQVET